MEFTDLLSNDTLSNFYKEYHLTEEKKENRIKEISTCNHLFIKTSNFYKEPTVECIYCSLNNRTLNFYKLFLERLEKDSLLYKYYNKNLPFEANLFKQIYPNVDIDKLPLLTNEVLNTFHASILYQAAREISNTDDLEINFNLMKELNLLEDEYDKIKISKRSDIYPLLKKYYENQNVKVYKK